MMVALQILSKVLQTQDDSIIEDNLLTVDYFGGYEEEYNFIKEHKEQYGNIPDKDTFLSHFKNFEILEVNESDRYLLDTIQEEYLYAQSVPVIQKAADLLSTDANASAEYLLSQMPRLQPNYHIGGVDIVAQAQERFTEYQERKDNQKNWYFESGFKELDEAIHGIKRGEEFIVIVARLGEGKSWVLTKICSHVWKTGYNVGYISPEMSAMAVGFRFDTLISNFSNSGLMWGKSVEIDDNAYQEYVDDLKKNGHIFKVATPLDFNKRITISKLRNFVKQNKLDLLAIDGIKYLKDERGQKNDNLTTTLTNISEDLMELSMELKIPIITVVQANRGGASSADEDGAPTLEDIRDSDGIGHNASIVLSLKQKVDNVLEIDVPKNRFGKRGLKYNYVWNINTGEFTFKDGGQARIRKKSDDEKPNKHKGSTDVF